MIVYDVSGVKAFNPLALCVFPFAKRKWFFTDDSNRRLMAKSGIVFSIFMLILALVLPIIGVWTAANNDFVLLIYSGAVFFFTASVGFIFQPKVFYVQTQPSDASVTFSRVYMFEWQSIWLLLLLTLQLNAINMSDTAFAPPLQVLSLFPIAMSLIPPAHWAYILITRGPDKQQ